MISGMQEASRTQLTNEETNQDTSSLESEVSKIATRLVYWENILLIRLRWKLQGNRNSNIKEQFKYFLENGTCSKVGFPKSNNS